MRKIQYRINASKEVQSKPHFHQMPEGEATEH